MALGVSGYSVSVFKLNEENSFVPKYAKDCKVRTEYDPQGLNVKVVKDDGTVCLEFPVHPGTECCRTSHSSYMFTIENETLLFKFNNREDARAFTIAITKVKSGKGASVFSVRTEDSSATQYFQFYGYLSQQQNMLQDFVRTYTYQRAILGNLNDFKDKIVLDVGAGSGILSFFAAQAGAAKVYAVEASTMAHYAQKLVAANDLANVIVVIPGKIEEIELPEKVDVIISEPMGYMLYNERMLETYLHAKKWLKAGGKMFPSRGDLHIAPFTDDSLYMEQYSKANFWFQSCFHGVNLSALQNCAVKEYFRQPIVDTFDIRICMSKSVRHVVDFQDAEETDLHTIEIPLEFHLLESGTCHGLAFWFDVAFMGSQQNVWLSTGPTEPLTHWYQVRCLLEQPLLVKQGQVLTGKVLLVANTRQSYDVTIELHVEGTNQSSSNTLDLKNPYFRYTGAPVQPPPGVSNVSPSENYWSQLDAQGVRNAVNMVNGMQVNGLGEVSMDTTQSVISNNLITNNLIALEGAQPNIHPGCISSTGRGRVAASPTSTHTAQLIGGAISPSLFTSPNVQQRTRKIFRLTRYIEVDLQRPLICKKAEELAMVQAIKVGFDNFIREAVVDINGLDTKIIENNFVLVDNETDRYIMLTSENNNGRVDGNEIVPECIRNDYIHQATNRHWSALTIRYNSNYISIVLISTIRTTQAMETQVSDVKITAMNLDGQQPLVMANYPVSANLMIGDYVTPGNSVSLPAYRQ